MPRYFIGKKSTVEDCRSVSVGAMAREGIFRWGPGYRASWRWSVTEEGEQKEVASMGLATVGHEGVVTGVVFAYTITRYNGEKVPCRYEVRIDRTPCHFGGWRYWFVCPLVVGGRPCHQRVAKLYLPPGGTYYGCRHCYNLTYESVQRHDKRVDALMKLPWEALEDLADRAGMSQRMLALQTMMKRLRR